MTEPKFTISKSKVLEQYKIVEGISDIVSYSSKTNPKITSILEENTNSLFSIHNVNELKNVKDKSRVVFLAQAWNKEIIKELINKKIKWFVVDNEKDLDILLDFLKNNEEKINILLRFKLKENSIRTERYYVFGMTSETISKRVKEIRSNSKLNSRIENLGIHFHRKSQNISEWNFQFELEESFDKSFFEKIDIVNIGGGLPCFYANTNVNVLEGIYSRISKLKNWLNEKNIKLMMEPGRFICAPAGKLHCRIIGIYDNTIVVNASVYNSDLDALIVPVKLLVEGELEKSKGISYVIKGVTPCSMDIFRYRVYLKEKKVGDEIIFINAGAYNFSSDFCDLDKIKTEIVE